MEYYQPLKCDYSFLECNVVLSRQKIQKNANNEKFRKFLKSFSFSSGNYGFSSNSGTGLMFILKI